MRAITSYGLELAWRLRIVSCSECSLAMQWATLILPFAGTSPTALGGAAILKCKAQRAFIVRLLRCLLSDFGAARIKRRIKLQYQTGTIS